MTEERSVLRWCGLMHVMRLPNVFGIEPRSPAWGRSSAPMPCWAAHLTEMVTTSRLYGSFTAPTTALLYSTCKACIASVTQTE